MTSRTNLKRTITVVLVIANLCLLIIYVSAWASPRAQNNKKTISRWRTLLVYPAEITDFKVDGKPVNSDEEFDAGADWLQNLSFKLKNKSDKTITFTVIDLDFPETAAVSGGRIAQRQITLGQDPENRLGAAPLQLLPGKSMDIRLDAEYSGIKTLLTRWLPIDNVTKVTVRLHQVMFDDGTLWSAGTTYRRNPNTGEPNKWIKIDH